MSKHDHQWDPDFFSRSRLFNPIAACAEMLTAHHPEDWPGLDDYQRLMNEKTGVIRSHHGVPIRFVSNGTRPSCFGQRYEPRIYLAGEVQTRTAHWHDFFQVLVWCLFPQTKARLNALHYHAAVKRHSATPQQKNRGPLENALTLFDECGMIIASSDPSLLNLIRNHEWKQLFWRRRYDVERHLHCIVFGHALYEKALAPYIGMTGHALLIHVDRYFHQLRQQQQLSQLDAITDALFAGNEDVIDTGILTPFPLLGMPGWDSDNDNEHYYDNSDYFRPRPGKPPSRF